MGMGGEHHSLFFAKYSLFFAFFYSKIKLMHEHNTFIFQLRQATDFSRVSNHGLKTHH